ncbi:MAG: hypothetical protein IAE79_26530 [Anaerolinea sp.]|nr:hypothetical protein [Anaerolinea sp.]
MSKKRKPLSRKQLKEQRAAQKARIREQRAWEPPAAAPMPNMSYEEAEALQDMLGENESVATRKLAMIVANSMTWVDEPEFDDIFASPLACVEALAEVTAQRGVSPEDVAAWDEDAQDDFHEEIQQEVAARVLTPEVKERILTALEALGQRWRKQLKKQQANEATLLRLLLAERDAERDAELKVAWQMTGLVNALVGRSLTVGFELMEAVSPSMEQADEQVTILDALENIPPEAEAKTTKLLNNMPGLRRVFEKQVDDMWDKGTHAVYAGDLYLGLFNATEVTGVRGIMQALVTALNQHETLPENVQQEYMTRFIGQIDAYIMELMTPARLAQLHARLRQIMETEAVDARWLPFVALLYGDLREENALEILRPFLNYAMIGELRRATANDEEE